jgi:hypothetical protein
MAFPPNYNQDRTNRARAKAKKALDKQLRRDEKSALRKQDRSGTDGEAAPAQDNEEQS